MTKIGWDAGWGRLSLAGQTTTRHADIMAIKTNSSRGCMLFGSFGRETDQHASYTGSQSAFKRIYFNLFVM